MTASTLIRGGTVVTACDMGRADVLLRGERVAAVAAPGTLRAEQVVDAGGCLVLPGGVDGHVHLENPALGVTRSADDFFSGTVAAACGGTTTIVDFVKKEPERSLRDSFLRRRERASEHAVVDFGFHTVVPADVMDNGGFDELRGLADEGSSSWKFFMAYPGTLMLDWSTLAAGIEIAAESGVLPVVHAEDGEMVAAATRDLVRQGRTAAHHHLDAHPDFAELHAVQRLSGLAERLGTPVLVLHVSSASAAAEIGRAQRDGVQLFAETCPQYLVRAYEDYRELGDDAAKFVCSPPIRPRDNQAGLWRAVCDGAITTIGTDHSPFTIGQPADLPPQKGYGRGFFPKIPNGVPGVQERLAVFWSAAVATGRLTPQRFVDLVATAPAKLLGLYPRKGAIVVGADADVVVWDPSATRVLSTGDLAGRADYTLYEGMEVTGAPRLVISRGRVVAERGEFCGQRGDGEYLHRRVSPPVGSDLMQITEV